MAGLLILLFAVAFSRRSDDDFKVDSVCRHYGCGNYSAFSSYEQCEMIPKDKQGNDLLIVELNPCNINEQCNIDPKNSSNSVCGNLKNRYGDETCTIYNTISGASSCVSNLSCVQGKCKTTGSCKVTEECGTDQYCDGSTCQTLKVGGSTCTADYQCAFPYGCNEGTCIKYFSLASGVAVSCEPTTNVNYFCTSASCYDNRCVTSVYVATSTSATKPDDLDSLIDSGARACKDSSATCSIHNDNSATTHCSCGYNLEAKAYCSMLAGDWPYNELLAFYNKWVTNNQPTSVNQKCHTLRRWEPECIFGVKQTWTKPYSYIDIAWYYYLTQNYVGLQDNNECSELSFNYGFQNASFYYDYEHNTLVTKNDDDDFALGLTAILLALIA